MTTPVLVAPGALGMLSILTPWLDNPAVSEIMINQPGEVFIEEHGQMTRHELPELTRLYLRRLFTFIANESGQILNEVHPLLSASLFDGTRVQLVIPPVTPHYTLSIRRQSIHQLNLLDYQQQGFFEQAKPFFLGERPWEEHTDETLQSLYAEKNWAAFLKQAVLARKTIILSGGTSSGKTTFLNALLQEIPSYERIITLEDTHEVSMPHENQVNLLASKGEQGKAKVSMQDLLQSCLRLRPDRIIMGEVRGAEILDFISSCSTGHAGSMTSIHANNPQIAFMRMAQMYKLNNVPSMTEKDILNELHTVIDIIVQVGKTERGRQLLHCYYKDAA
jgi:type IV secretion system protein VirB11